MKQTALDWFIENLPNRFKNAILNECGEEIKKAKAMEQQKKLITEIMEADAKDGLYEYTWVLIIQTRGSFLWRLWFLISAPIIWLIKGEVKIK